MVIGGFCRFVCCVLWASVVVASKKEKGLHRTTDLQSIAEDIEGVIFSKEARQSQSKDRFERNNRQSSEIQEAAADLDVLIRKELQKRGGELQDVAEGLDALLNKDKKSGGLRSPSHLQSVTKDIKVALPQEFTTLPMSWAPVSVSRPASSASFSKSGHRISADHVFVPLTSNSISTVASEDRLFKTEKLGSEKFDHLHLPDNIRPLENLNVGSNIVSRIQDFELDVSDRLSRIGDRPVIGDEPILVPVVDLSRNTQIPKLGFRSGRRLNEVDVSDKLLEVLSEMTVDDLKPMMEAHGFDNFDEALASVLGGDLTLEGAANQPLDNSPPDSPAAPPLAELEPPNAAGPQHSAPTSTRCVSVVEVPFNGRNHQVSLPCGQQRDGWSWDRRDGQRDGWSWDRRDGQRDGFFGGRHATEFPVCPQCSYEVAQPFTAYSSSAHLAPDLKREEIPIEGVSAIPLPRPPRPAIEVDSRPMQQSTGSSNVRGGKSYFNMESVELILSEMSTDDLQYTLQHLYDSGYLDEIPETGSCLPGSPFYPDCAMIRIQTLMDGLSAREKLVLRRTGGPSGILEAILEGRETTKHDVSQNAGLRAKDQKAMIPPATNELNNAALQPLQPPSGMIEMTTRDCPLGFVRVRGECKAAEAPVFNCRLGDGTRGKCGGSTITEVCPDQFELSANSCVFEFAPIETCPPGTELLRGACVSSNLHTHECPSGFLSHGEMCVPKRGRRSDDSVVVTDVCPAGYIPLLHQSAECENGSACNGFDAEGNLQCGRWTEGKKQCQEGFTLRERSRGWGSSKGFGECQKVHIHKPKSAKCRKGFVREGDTCIQRRQVAPVQTCSEGQLEGSNCVVLHSEVPTYSCPHGFEVFEEIRSDKPRHRRCVLQNKRNVREDPKQETILAKASCRGQDFELVSSSDEEEMCLRRDVRPSHKTCHSFVAPDRSCIQTLESVPIVECEVGQVEGMHCVEVEDQHPVVTCPRGSDPAGMGGGCLERVSIRDRLWEENSAEKNVRQKRSKRVAGFCPLGSRVFRKGNDSSSSCILQQTPYAPPPCSTCASETACRSGFLKEGDICVGM